MRNHGRIWAGQNLPSFERITPVAMWQIREARVGIGKPVGTVVHRVNWGGPQDTPANSPGCHKILQNFEGYTAILAISQIQCELLASSVVYRLNIKSCYCPFSAVIFLWSGFLVVAVTESKYCLKIDLKQEVRLALQFNSKVWGVVQCPTITHFPLAR